MAKFSASAVGHAQPGQSKPLSLFMLLTALIPVSKSDLCQICWAALVKDLTPPATVAAGLIFNLDSLIIRIYF